MLMVIIGAGASYDSCPTYPAGRRPKSSNEVVDEDHRPPLANQLFDNRPAFAKALVGYPECLKIAPYLRQLPQDKTLEAVLQDLQSAAVKYPEKERQFAEVRCYLHDVITRSAQSWSEVGMGVSNYKTLLYEIDRTRKTTEPVCLVTFNYDTLLDDALWHSGLSIDKLADYIGRHAYYRLFKLHGSVNWAREVELTLLGNTNMGDPHGVLRQVIARAKEMRVTDRYLFSPSKVMGIVQGKLAFPAIAVPVERKQQFECPEFMLEELRKLLPEVTAILTIGWRATEAHFLELLKQGVKRSVQLHVVAGPRIRNYDPPGEEVSARLCTALPHNSYSPPFIDPGGFTDFILTGRARQFLDT